MKDASTLIIQQGAKMTLKILRLPEVLDRVGYRRSKIYALIREQQFPQPVALGPRACGFLETEVDAWIQARVAARDAEAAA